MKIWVLLSAAFLAVGNAQECTAYVCDPPDVTWPKGTCAMQDPLNETQIFIRECNSKQYCPVEWMMDSASCRDYYDPKPMPEPVAAPGERCDRLRACFSGTCEDGFCSSTTSPCVNVYDCGVGFFCDGQGNCQKQVPAGGACTLDTDCFANAACDIAEDGAPLSGQCTQYYSLKPGDAVQSCYGSTTSLNSHPLCSSGFCFETATSGLFACSEFVSSISPPPIRCSAMSSFCSSTVDSISGLSVESMCGCGLDGYSYCPPFPGDSDLADYRADLQAFLSNSEILGCNTFRHSEQVAFFDPTTYSTCAPKFTTTLMYHRLRIVLYTEVAMAPSCAIKVVLPGYYDAMKEMNSRSVDGLLLLGGGALVGVIIYIFLH